MMNLLNVNYTAIWLNVLQLKVKKRLVYGAIVAIWIMFPTLLTTTGCMSTNIVKGICVPWGAYVSYNSEKAINSSILVFTYLLPNTTMMFCYARVLHTIMTKVSSTLTRSVKIMLPTVI